MCVISLRNICLIIALNFLPFKVDCEKSKIIGGWNASYPFMASIQYHRVHLCGGSIINERTVITAAHCLHKFPVVFLRVHVGENCRKVIEGEIHNVADTHVHGLFSPETLDYDVGLIRIQGSFIYKPTVQPIKLAAADYTIPTNSCATVLGWGYTTPEGSPSECLKQANVPILNANVCRFLLGNSVTDRMLCAGYKCGGIDACKMDSGGPLFLNETLVGIVSWGIGCAKPLSPGVYARVSALVPWVEDVLLQRYNEVL